MTQVATPETVLAPFDNVTLEARGRSYRLTRRGDEFWIDMAEPDWEAMLQQRGADLSGIEYKVGWYLDVSNETRRLMWRLAHAHGTLLGLLNIAFALTLLAALRESPRAHALPARCLAAASLLLPAGFLLGGIDATGGDPGRGILLVPAGAMLLLIAVALTAWMVQSRPPADGSRPLRGPDNP